MAHHTIHLRATRLHARTAGVPEQGEPGTLAPAEDNTHSLVNETAACGLSTGSRGRNPGSRRGSVPDRALPARVRGRVKGRAGSCAWGGP